MPLKWIIFRITNYLLLVATSLMLLALGYLLTSEGLPRGGEGLLMLLFVLGSLSMVLNFINNGTLIEHYFPDTRIQQRQKTLMIIGFTGTVLTGTFIAIVMGKIILRAIEYGEGFYTSKLDLAILVVISMLVLSLPYVLWMQIVLVKTIKRNKDQQYTDFLDQSLNR